MQWIADMSPIEHVWDGLGRRVRNRVPPIQEWKNIPQLRTQNVLQSMRRRCQVCIQANGGHGHKEY